MKKVIKNSAKLVDTYIISYDDSADCFVAYCADVDDKYTDDTLEGVCNAVESAFSGFGATADDVRLKIDWSKEGIRDSNVNYGKILVVWD